MTPEQIATLTAIAEIVSKIGTWPIGYIICAVVLGPWIILVLVSRSMEKRHEAAMAMYKSNVKLVESYEIVASEQADTIRLSTAATVELTTYLRNKVPCHERIAERLPK
ncbi:MAG: hypothetical protein NTV58_12235 [Deltaproteobacteria bacterium]|nr:hypothetical protein [Deltaproteobacteria bacterium]